MRVLIGVCLFVMVLGVMIVVGFVGLVLVCWSFFSLFFGYDVVVEC